MNKLNTWKTAAIAAWTLVAVIAIVGGTLVLTANAEATEANDRLNVCLADAKNAEKLAVETQAWADKAVDDGLEWINVKRYNTAVQRNASYLDCK